MPVAARQRLNRVVWELKPGIKDRRRTLFISGSHKTAYAAPDSALETDSPLRERMLSIMCGPSTGLSACAVAQGREYKTTFVPIGQSAAID